MRNIKIILVLVLILFSLTFAYSSDFKKLWQNKGGTVIKQPPDEKSNTTNMNQIKPVLSFYSDKFPSYEITSEITEGIKIKFAEGNGETKSFFSFTLSGGKNHLYIPGGIDVFWDDRVVSKKILNNFSALLSCFINSKKVKVQADLSRVYDMQRNIVEYEVHKVDASSNDTSFDEKLKKMKQEFYKVLSEENIPAASILANVGRTIKTGNEIRTFPLRELSKFNIELKGLDPNITIQEIVAGWSTYKGKKVIVTQILLNYGDKSNNFEMRAKGYNIYEAETFIMLAGKGAGYSNLENSVSIQMDWSYETNVNKIYAVHDSFEHTSTALTNEKNIPEWHETTKKIEALGDLLNKGLITQEEFDRKKAELLEKF